MNKKSIFDYLILGLFILCMGLAMTAALDYVGAAQDRPYLKQGVLLLSTMALALLAVVALRLCRKAAVRIKPIPIHIAAYSLFAVILVVGLLLRLQVINNSPVSPADEYKAYYDIGALLSRGELRDADNLSYRQYIAKFPSMFGYPRLILSRVFSVFGESARAALMTNLAFSLGSIALVFFLARQAGCGLVVSLLCMAAMAFWPSYIQYAGVVAPEPSFTFLLLLCILAFIMLTRRSRNLLRDRFPVAGLIVLIALGIMLGFANSIRPTMALVLVIAMCITFLLTPRVKLDVETGAIRQALSRGWLCALVVCCCYFLTTVILAQSVTDAIGMKTAAGITGAGYSVMTGTNAQSGGRWNEEDAAFFDKIFAETGSAREAHNESMQVALSRIVNNPEDTLNLFVYKYRDLWQSDDYAAGQNPLRLAEQDGLTAEDQALAENQRAGASQFYFMALLFALISAIQKWSGKERVGPAMHLSILFFIGTALLHMFMQTQIYFHYAMIPLLLLLSACAMTSWQERVALSAVVPSMRIRKKEGVDDDAEDLSGPKKKPALGEMSSPFSAYDMVDAIQDGHITVTLSRASVLSAQAEKERGETQSTAKEPAPDAQE